MPHHNLVPERIFTMEDVQGIAAELERKLVEIFESLDSLSEDARAICDHDAILTPEGRRMVMEKVQNELEAMQTAYATYRVFVGKLVDKNSDQFFEVDI
jgi:hypothetical protein